MGRKQRPVWRGARVLRLPRGLAPRRHGSGVALARAHTRAPVAGSALPCGQHSKDGACAFACILLTPRCVRWLPSRPTEPFAP